MTIYSRLLLALALALLLAGPTTAQSPQYEPGVIAVRNDAGRWELLRVAPGTEEAHLVALASAGRETTRLHVLTIEQQDPPPRPLPFDSPVYLPAISRDYDPHVPADPLWPEQWNARMVGVERQDRRGGATIAILDTGLLDPRPEDDLGAVMWDEIDGDDDPTSDFYHGTHVASVALAPHNGIGIAGVCGECQAMIVRVCQTIGCNESDLYAGVAFAIANGADVINLSLGGPMDMPYLHQAIDDALAAGIVVIAATGNNGSDTPNYPAAWDGVVAVGAVDQDGERPWTSCYGPWIDFVAPGVEVLGSCGGTEYCYRSGTSMAAPHVAGAFGLMLSEHPEWTSQQAYDWLAAHAVKQGEPGWDDWYGWGMVRVR